MRPADSAYDRNTAERRDDDMGVNVYALITDHNGPCSLVAQYDSLDAAIEAARALDTSEAPTELEDEIDYDGSSDNDDRGLIEAAQRAGWRIVAKAGAGEYWTVMVDGE